MTDLLIICHREDEPRARELADRLSLAGLSGRSCSNVNSAGSLARCSRAVVVMLSAHSKADQDIIHLTNQVTGKGKRIIRYMLDDTVFGKEFKDLMYFLQKSAVIDGRAEDAADRLRALIESIPRQVLIAADEARRDAARDIRQTLDQRCISAEVRIIAQDTDPSDIPGDCGDVVVLVTARQAWAEQAAEAAREKGKSVFIHRPDDDRSPQALAGLADRIRAAIEEMPTIDSRNTGNIKAILKPAGKVITSLIFAQLLVFLLWLTSKYSIYYSLLMAAALAAFILTLVYYGRRCALRGCRNRRHTVKRVNIVGSRRHYLFGFCDEHGAVNDVSADKKSYPLLPVALVAATALFVFFLSAAEVKAQDFSLLDIRRRIASRQPVEFTDPGFEAYIRDSLGFGADPIIREDLEDVTELVFPDEPAAPILSLEDLRYFPGLVAFDCDEAENISGDLACFSYAPRIEFINLGISHIYGDIGSLSGLPLLQTLNRHFVDRDDGEVIYGDIASLQNLKNLEQLHLPDTGITGSLDGINGLDLTVLVLYGTGVSGDLSALSRMDRLNQLILSSLEITGDLSMLEDLKQLFSLELGDTSVTGDIAVLKGLNLSRLDLCFTGIRGNVSALKDMSGLEYLKLDGTDIAGDLSSMSGLTGLRLMQIDRTGITGDLADMSNLTNLEYMRIVDTGIHGDIAALTGMEHLQEVYLHGLNVTGDAAVFKSMKELRLLLISDTGIYGDTSALEGVDMGDVPVSSQGTDLNIPENMISTLARDWRKVFAEDAAAMAANQGGQFGGIESKRPVEDGFEFAGRAPAFMPLNTNLDAFDGVEPLGNQGVYLKFKPSAGDIRFTFLSESSRGEATVVFDASGASLQAAGENQALLFRPGLVLQPDMWYHLFMAMDSGGRIRAVLWPEGSPSAAAYLDTALGQSGNGGAYRDQSWKFFIGTGEAGAFTLEQYGICAFGEFTGQDDTHS